MKRGSIAIILFILVALGQETYTITFDDIGIGTTHISPLSIVEKKTYFVLERTGIARVTIRLFYRGNIVVTLKINNTSKRIQREGTMEVYMRGNNTLQIEIVNTGLNDAVIYGNSTITIDFSCLRTRKKNATPELQLALLLSVVIPPILIAIVRRYIRGRESRGEEIVVV